MLKRFCQLSQSNHDNQARSIPPEGLFESRLLSSQKKSANDLALNCQARDCQEICHRLDFSHSFVKVRFATILNAEYL